MSHSPEDRIDPRATLPFVGVHLACLGALWVGWSPAAVGVCALAYLVRMFAITAGYHRYFSHRAFRTGRLLQFLLAFVGGASAQLGPLWWAAHHRWHHSHSDTEQDIHPPGLKGFLWSHMGWIFCPRYRATDYEKVKDFAVYPELMFLDRQPLVAPILMALGMWELGGWLERVAPGLGTSASQMLVWGFFVSTVALYHATFCINSLAHVAGTRRYPTRDDSRNNLWLALLTLGEGWHNNHHRYPSAAAQGFYWWEIDMTYLALRGLERLGLVWELRPVPASAYLEAACSAPTSGQRDQGQPER